MVAWLPYPLALLAGYLVGSVSFAVLISKARGVDIFTIGSGNPGATNVMRALGRPFGYACFLLDALKGVAGVLIGFGLAQLSGEGTYLAGILGLLGAILGHSFSLFLKFRGGKGVATTVGGLFTLMPLVMLASAIVWLAVFSASRYVSLASIALGLSLPAGAWLIHDDPRTVGLCAFLALVIVVRHRANIRRLLNGTENRAGTRKQP
jgi:glycerol-3-phosphate acyltransferase PlsY